MSGHGKKLCLDTIMLSRKPCLDAEAQEGLYVGIILPRRPKALVFLPSPISLLTDSSPEGSVNWRSATRASQDLLSAQSALVPYRLNKAVASD